MADLAREGRRTLVDATYVPASAEQTSRLVGRVDGTIGEESATFYVFQAVTTKDRLVVVSAKDEKSAERCMLLLDSKMKFWDIFASYLKHRFVWPLWLSLRSDVQQLAEDIRAGLDVLAADADGYERNAREALYESAGLNFDNYGTLGFLYSLECEPWDIFKVFDHAERVPSYVLNLYLTVAWNSVRYFDELERVDASSLKEFIRYGLAEIRPEPTAKESLEHNSMSDLRQLVKLSGTSLKARSGSVLREHLLAHMTPALEAESKQRMKRPKYQLLPPDGLTWEGFQSFRSDYQSMLHALSWWIFNGTAPNAVYERFKTAV